MAVMFCSFDCIMSFVTLSFFFQAEDGIRDRTVTGVQTCALPRVMSPPGEPRKSIRSLLCGRSRSGLRAGVFLPDAAEVHDYFDRFFHVLRRHPLEARVEVVLAGKQVRRWKSHEGEARSVGAAANRAVAHLEPRASHGLVRVLHHGRMPI